MKYEHRIYLKLAATLGLLLTVGLFLTIGCTSSGPPTDGNAALTATDTTSSEVIDLEDRPGGFYPGQSLRFDRISLEEGLSQSTVFSILQDKQGFMWFGTEDGLNKYDGYTFTTYKSDPDNPNSLASNWIQTLYKDREGRIWIGTAEGLDLFNPVTETFTHYRNNPENIHSISANHITAIVQDQDGIVWIGTSDGGINSFNPETEIFNPYRFDPDNPDSISSDSITSLHEDKDGFIWVGTRNGLNVFNRKKESWVRFLPESTNPTSLNHENISAISEDNAGALWIGLDGGGLSKLVLSETQRERLRNGQALDKTGLNFRLFLHDPDNPASLSSNDIWTIYKDADGYLWIGTRTSGVSVLSPGSETFFHIHHNPGNPESLNNNWILSIIQDQEGVYWFGSIGAGVNKLSLGWKNFALYHNISNNSASLGNDMVRAFQLDQDSLWIGTMFAGLDRLERKTGNWDHYSNIAIDPDSLSSNFVSEIFQDRSRNLWVGTANGLDRFDPDLGVFTHYLPDPLAPPGSLENNIRGIFENEGGEFWIGTQAGLHIFNLENNQWSQLDFGDPDNLRDLNSAWIISFLEDQQGDLWIMTWGAGLFRLHLATDEISHYHHDPGNTSSLSSNNITSGFQDSAGVIWFSTTRGLNRFDLKDETFTQYLEKDGLPNETVYCALDDLQGNLWISTNKGISRFDPQEEIFRNYDKDDGLQSDEFNSRACYRSGTGEMFFGGINGFNTFFPDKIKSNSYIPPVVITSFKQNGENINLNQSENEQTEIILDWSNNAFEFEYAALSYNQPSKNQYAYILEGFEKDIHEVGTRRYGQYTNLPGGTYTLRVKGSNNDGVWNDIGTSVLITVVPPFWGTWWFRGLVLATVIGVSYGGFKLRVRNLEKRGRELEIQVKDRTDQLMEVAAALKETDLQRAVMEERNRLARELHDSVTQSLYSLTLFTEAARHLSEATGDEKLEGYLGQIGSLGLQALKEMRLLVFELGLHALTEDDLVEALEKRLKAVEGRTGVDAKIINKGYQIQPPYIETQLFRIAQEALNNALKHAGASSVEVHFQQEGTTLVMEIIDDGVGFKLDPMKEGPGMGLNNIKDRVDRMEGTLEIESSPGKGTRLKVSISTDGPLILK